MTVDLNANQKVLLNEHEEDEYVSSEDSDFAPDEVVDGSDEVISDDEESEAGTQPSKKRKRTTNAKVPDGQDAADFENSGDEAVISKGNKKRRKKQARDGNMAPDADDEVDGPLIKTRAMKAVEKAERTHKATSGPVTVDVDALWASMISEPLVPSSKPISQQATSSPADPPSDPPSSLQNLPDAEVQKENQAAAGGNDDSPTITIKRTYNFAGRIVTETKTVARHSAEARLWLSTQQRNKSKINVEASSSSSTPGSDRQQQQHRIHRAFRSAFEPLNLLPPAGGVIAAAAATTRSDLNLGMANLLRAREEAAARKAQKLNTVEKSKLDWAAHVDEQEGMREELELAGRKKGNFGDTQDFLARVEGRRDEEERRVRLAGKV